LGLSTCYGILKQNNGNIVVFSEPGKGTTFEVYLPASKKTDVNVKEENTISNAYGTETILLVEDDEIIQEKLYNILTRTGYTVIKASNGDDAISNIINYSQSIDLLITDMVMPLIGGRELAVYLVGIYPKMKILFMSGYSDESIVHHGILESGMHFIQKPFTIEEFMMKIRETLDL
jgi:DNA-binding NtrC family response regulator